MRASTLLFLGFLLTATAVSAEEDFRTSSYAPIPEDLPVTVLGPDRSLDDIELAQRIGTILQARGFTVVEEEAEDGLLLFFTRECLLPPASDKKLGIGVGVLATEHGVSTDIDVDARVAAPLQRDAPEAPPVPALTITMRLTGTGQKPRLYWVGEIREPLGRKCSVDLSPELAERLIDDLAGRREKRPEPKTD